MPQQQLQSFFIRCIFLSLFSFLAAGRRQTGIFYFFCDFHNFDNNYAGPRVVWCALMTIYLEAAAAISIRIHTPHIAIMRWKCIQLIVCCARIQLQSIHIKNGFGAKSIRNAYSMNNFQYIQYQWARWDRCSDNSFIFARLARVRISLQFIHSFIYDILWAGPIPPPLSLSYSNGVWRRPCRIRRAL